MERMLAGGVEWGVVQRCRFAIKGRGKGMWMLVVVDARKCASAALLDVVSKEYRG